MKPHLQAFRGGWSCGEGTLNVGWGFTIAEAYNDWLEEFQCMGLRLDWARA